MKDFQNRIAVVSGGGAGMGREIVRQLLAEGCHVATCDVSAVALAQTAKLCDSGPRPHWKYSMRADGPTRVAYVVKRYPRFSETFVVNEILAHEAVGLDVEIFSLYPPNDTHFQDAISRVRAPVTYLTAESLRGVDLWSAIECAGNDVPFLWRSLDLARGADARVVYQGAWLAREIRRRGITHVHAHFATASAEVARL